MKTIHRLNLLLLAAVGPIAILFSSCSKSNDVGATAQNVKATAKEAVAEVKEAVADSWDTIKDYTHEKREDFAGRLERMVDKRDAEIQTLNARMTGLPDNAAIARDRAVKEFNVARGEMKSQLADLRTASAETWTAAKEKAAQAWQRMQDAGNKIKATATS
jgi:hypothetical protein